MPSESWGDSPTPWLALMGTFTAFARPKGARDGLSLEGPP